MYIGGPARSSETAIESSNWHRHPGSESTKDEHQISHEVTTDTPSFTGQAGHLTFGAYSRAKRANFFDAHSANPKSQRTDGDDNATNTNDGNAATRRTIDDQFNPPCIASTCGQDRGEPCTATTQVTHIDFTISDFRSDRGDERQNKRCFHSVLEFSVSGSISGLNSVTKQRRTTLTGTSDASSESDEDVPPLLTDSSGSDQEEVVATKPKAARISWRQKMAQRNSQT